MKAYGKPRCLNTKRNVPGTSRPCPCCVPRNADRKAKIFAGRARRDNKKACLDA